MEYQAGLSRNKKRRRRQYKKQQDATRLEPENDPESEIISDGDMPIVAPLEVGVAQIEAEPIGMVPSYSLLQPSEHLFVCG